MDIETLKEHIGLLKSELESKLKQLVDLSKYPGLFLSEYFFNLRNVIDIETEQKLVSLDEEKSDLVNKIREWIIDGLTKHEKQLIELVKHEERAPRNYAAIEKSINSRFDSDISKYKFIDESLIDLYNDEYCSVMFDIITEIDNLKCEFLRNQTFFFYPAETNGFGVLVHLEDFYYNEYETKCIVELKTIKSNKMKFAFEFIDKLRNKTSQSLIELQSKRVLTKKMTVLSHFDECIEKEMANVRAPLFDKSMFLVRMNQASFKATLNKTIDLSCTQSEIESIANDAFEFFPSLSSLNVDCNNLSSFNAISFSNIAGLNHISLTDNKAIKSVNFDGLENLTSLSLDGLDLVELNKDLFTNLFYLNDLYLSRNKLHALDPVLFKNLTNLKYLHLDRNNLSSLPQDLFGGLICLDRLILFKNNLRSIDNSLLANLTSLTCLDLSENRIENIDANAFLGMEQLADLNLSKNLLSKIDLKLFKNLKHLTRLSISDNKIKSIDVKIFKKLGRLNTLFLNGNHIENKKEVESFLRSLENLVYFSI